MRRVAVSQRIDRVKGRNETRDALDQNLIALLLEADLLPLPVPNILGSETDTYGNSRALKNWLKMTNTSGIILSGGNDIGSEPLRDRVETGLLFWAKENNLPALGICRGMQMMAVYEGGRLRPVKNHISTQHNLSGIITQRVNSFHNLALAECPSEYNVLAVSEDGCIEAIQHKTRPWHGCMWHPERDKPFHTSDLSRIKKVYQ